MAHYLSFEHGYTTVRESYFTDYTLGSTDLLPQYFGPLAAINIFLGENNSGKSRFMRDMIKPVRSAVYDMNFSTEEIIENIDLLLEKLKVIPPLLPEKIELNITGKIEQLDYIKKLLFFENAPDRERYSLNLIPKSNLDSVEEQVISLKKLISDQKSILTLIADKKSKSIDYLIELTNSINRAMRICSTLSTNVWGRRKLLYTSQINYSRHNLELFLYNLHNAENYHTEEEIKNFGEALESNIKPVIDLLYSIVSPFHDQKQINAIERKKIYIPILRTARKLVTLEGQRLNQETDIFEIATKKDYKFDATHNVEIKTGITLYKDIDSMYKARVDRRGRLHAFEAFLASAFFNGKQVVVVPEEENGSKGGNILITVDDEERDIHDLGDGIQALILLLFPLFMADKDTWFFIEEPETHLHPGFQRLFINTITKNDYLLSKELIVFMTTHSNHIIDFAIDEAKGINLFTFRKTRDENEKSVYQIQLTKQGDLESLNVLGVQNSSVFLSNCTIWLEGVTDRIYLAAYLKAYLAHAQAKFSLIEGLHYSFLEYAGSNVMHYDFEAQAHDSSITPQALQDIKALSISNRILLIADQDGGKKTKRDTQLSGQQHAGFEYRILDVREIENLLSKEVIVAALQKMYPKETFDVALLDAADYKDKYLGAYLRGKYPSIPDNFAPADGSGTIGSAKKRIFAERAAEAITSWGDMTPEAQQLTEEVYQFIVGHNPRLTSN